MGRVADRLMDKYISEKVDEIHRHMYNGASREEAIRKTPIRGGMAEYVHRHFPAVGPKVLPKPEVKARRQSADTLTVHMTAHGDHGEVREVRMPPGSSFQPKTVLDVLRAVYVCGQMAYVLAHPKPPNRTGRWKEATDNTPKLQSVGPGDIIELNNGDLYLIQRYGRSFRLLSKDDMIDYLKYPQALRDNHRLMWEGA